VATVVKTSVATQAARQGFGGARKSVSQWRARARTSEREHVSSSPARGIYTTLSIKKLSRSLSLAALRKKKKKKKMGGREKDEKGREKLGSARVP